MSTQKFPWKKAIQIAIAVLSALLGAIAEDKTNFMSNLSNLF